VNIVDPVKALLVRFPKGIGDVEERSESRVYVGIDPGMVRDVAGFLFNNLGARLIVITCLETRVGMELLYHFSFDGLGKIVSLRAVVRMPEPRIDAITPVIDGAEYFEREIMDLFGVEFVGHPNPTRFLLGDGWPEGVYPYRKEHRGKYPYRTEEENAAVRDQILHKGAQ
jgi:NADH-quinone oxidoreductase subunit C